MGKGGYNVSDILREANSMTRIFVLASTSMGDLNN